MKIFHLLLINQSVRREEKQKNKLLRYDTYLQKHSE